MNLLEYYERNIYIYIYIYIYIRCIFFFFFFFPAAGNEKKMNEKKKHFWCRLGMGYCPIVLQENECIVTQRLVVLAG